MKRFLKWLSNLFSSPSKPTEPVIAKAPKKEEPKPTFPEPIKKRKIAIARGHGGKDSGAEGNGTTEVIYNTWVMQELEKVGLNITCHYGDSSASAMLKAMATLPDLIIQMHINDADDLKANGCEGLVVKGDLKSYKFAEEFCEHINKKFNKPFRRASTLGKKILESNDRGVRSLVTCKLCPKLIVEPFFIKNKTDFIPKEQYLKAWIELLKKWGA